MFSNAIYDLFSFRTVIGLDAELSGESKLLYSCRLVVKGKILSASVAHSGLKNVLHFAKQYTAGPIALNIRGKGVLVRQLDHLDVLDQQSLHQIMPNARLEDFYYQLANNSNGGSTLSLIRKKDADTLISELASHGFSVVALSLNAEVENAAYQAGFALLVGDLVAVVDHPEVATSRLQAFAIAKLKGVAWLLGPVLLLLLLLNFFLLSHYSAMMQGCKLESHSSAAQVNKLQAMEDQLLAQTSLIRGLGWTAGMRYGILTDRLLSKIPPAISVQELKVNPLLVKSGSVDQGDIYQSNTATVSGSCLSAAQLNDWLFTLRSTTRVSSCVIDNYAVNPDSGRGQFLITINFSDDEL